MALREKGAFRRFLCEYQPILRRRKLYKCSSTNPQVLPGVTMEERIRITAESPWAVGWAEGIAKLAGYIPSTPEYHEEVRRLSRFVSERLWMG